MSTLLVIVIIVIVILLIDTARNVHNVRQRLSLENLILSEERDERDERVLENLRLSADIAKLSAVELHDMGIKWYQMIYEEMSNVTDEAVRVRIGDEILHFSYVVENGCFSDETWEVQNLFMYLQSSVHCILSSYYKGQ